MIRLNLVCLFCLILTACQNTFNILTPHTYKIALVAPFEGRQRQIGYDAFPALRMAVREQIETQRHSLFQITFIAYNDNADPSFATKVAGNVAIDPDTLVVIGHLLSATTQAAQPTYNKAGLPVLTLDETPTDCANQVFHFEATPEQRSTAQPNIDAHYREASGGPPPGDSSAPAYLATQYALAAVRSAAAPDGQPTRARVARVLAQQAGCQ